MIDSRLTLNILKMIEQLKGCKVIVKDKVRLFVTINLGLYGHAGLLKIEVMFDKTEFFTDILSTSKMAHFEPYSTCLNSKYL